LTDFCFQLFANLLSFLGFTVITEGRDGASLGPKLDLAALLESTATGGGGTIEAALAPREDFLFCGCAMDCPATTLVDMLNGFVEGFAGSGTLGARCE